MKNQAGVGVFRGITGIKISAMDPSRLEVECVAGVSLAPGFHPTRNLPGSTGRFLLQLFRVFAGGFILPVIIRFFGFILPLKMKPKNQKLKKTE